MLIALGCAGRSPAIDGPSLPVFQEFQTSPQNLSIAAASALHSSSLNLELDTRRTTLDTLITQPLPLSKRTLKQLAAPGITGLKGKLMGAELQLVLSIRSSYTQSEFSRITVQPIFLVYVSRWRDQRQWIQWYSNNKLENEIITSIEAELNPLE